MDSLSFSLNNFVCTQSKRTLAYCAHKITFQVFLSSLLKYGNCIYIDLCNILMYKFISKLDLSGADKICSLDILFDKNIKINFWLEGSCNWFNDLTALFEQLLR